MLWRLGSVTPIDPRRAVLACLGPFDLHSFRGNVPTQ